MRMEREETIIWENMFELYPPQLSEIDKPMDVVGFAVSQKKHSLFKSNPISDLDKTFFSCIN